VLEAIPDGVAELVREQAKVPVIGIGAGSGCDGQVLVTHDVLGLFDRFTPHFAKKYVDLYSLMTEAFAQYIADVATRRFPAAEHATRMDTGELAALLKEVRAGEEKLQRVR
jgi:3-methyl-2-oxobutanoate hydroxymethyltransferase